MTTAAHIAYGFLNSLVAVSSPALAIIMFLLFIIYEFEETIVDYFVLGKKEAAAWDWPEEELLEYGAGISAGAVAVILATVL